MAAKVGAVKGLAFGLVVAAMGLAALPENADAGRKGASPSIVQQLETPAGRQAAQVPINARIKLALADTAPEAPSPEQVATIARAQRCLMQLGYYKGEVDGKSGRGTRSAFKQFKREHGLSGYTELLDETVQQKIAELCKISDDTAALGQANDPLAPVQDGDAVLQEGEGADGVALAPDPNVGEDGAASPEPAPGSLDLDCLAEDLLAVLRRAHGLGVAVRTCERPCVAAPKGLPQAQLDALQGAGGVVWCRDCLPIGGQLPLDDVRRIERAGNVHLCPAPQRQFSKYGEGITDGLRSYMRVRELYRSLPPAAEDPGAIAVIIGNRSYEQLPRSVTSYNDADAVYAFLTEHLGYRPDNIIDLRDAKKADLDKVFGAEPGSDGDLARLVEGQPDAKILIYYSGHGAAGEADAETYLLPVDAELHREASGGYKLSTLYASLAALEAKSVLVLLEMDFGRDRGPSVLPPNLPGTLGTGLPQAPVPALTVLLATDRGQRSLPDISYDIGLFTRYAIEALAGGADRPPVGNGDGALDSAEIYAFTAAFVDLAARKTFGVLQRPVYSGAGANVLTSARPAPSGSN
jgi:hypothetical protein